MLKRTLRIVSVGCLLACAYTCVGKGKHLPGEVREALKRSAKRPKKTKGAKGGGKKDGKENGTETAEEKAARELSDFQAALLDLTDLAAWKGTYVPPLSGLHKGYQHKVLACWEQNSRLGSIDSIQTALKNFGSLVEAIQTIKQAEGDAKQYEAAAKQVKESTEFRSATAQLSALVQLIGSDEALCKETVTDWYKKAHIHTSRLNQLKAFLPEVRNAFKISEEEVTQAEDALKEALKI